MEQMSELQISLTELARRHKEAPEHDLAVIMMKAAIIEPVDESKEFYAGMLHASALILGTMYAEQDAQTLTEWLTHYAAEEYLR